MAQPKEAIMAIKRTTILLAALAAFSFMAVDAAAPAFAQSVAPTRGGDGPGNPGGGDPGTPGTPGTNGEGGMRSIGCSGYGWANMPGFCVSQAMACECPTETSKNYRKPASCGAISVNQRRAAERECLKVSRVSYRPRD
jgi:hypothetical protein